MAALESRPGFRRRFRVTPEAGLVTAALEDDYHAMAVTLGHDGQRIVAVEPQMDRAPWTTCPGAIEVLRATFIGVALAEAESVVRRQKQANCTHLYDLAVLAAAHAGDSRPFACEIIVSDPVDGLAVAEIRRDGEAILRFEHRDDRMIAPADVAGLSLFKLRGWIDSLPPASREAARLLQWGTILAHGRTIPLAEQSDATLLPPSCFTFQPENRGAAQRVGRIIDFSDGPAEPLERFDGHRFASPAA
jgi:hypothetical protein